MMKSLTYLSAILSALTLIRLRKSLGVIGLFLVWIKTLAGALAPIMTLMGALGALAGLLRRDRPLALAGLFATAISARHISLVSSSKDDLFTQAFGLNWHRRIPADKQARMLPRRWPSRLPTSGAGVRWRRDIAFDRHRGTKDPLLCDIWLPPAEVEPSGVAIIYLHGSAWHFSDKDMFTRPFFCQLASQGHAVMDVAYTLAPKANLKGMVGDVKEAIAWLKEHAADFDVNPERLVLMGGSAGGHLALLAAYTPNHPAFQPAELQADTAVHAVVCYYGFSDMVETYHYLRLEDYLASPAILGLLDQAMVRAETYSRKARLLPEYSEWSGLEMWMINLFGGTPDEVPDLYALGSPLSHVDSECPPTLLLQGAHDFGGMVEQNRRLSGALRKAGVLTLYLEFPDTEHAFDLILPQINPAAQTATYYTERFLALI